MKKAVITLAAKARSLGLALGLSVSKLDTIRSDFNDSDEVLTEVLNTWLKQAYDVEKYGCPSWRSLARAVDNDAGGRNSALANKIAADGIYVHTVQGILIFSEFAPSNILVL